MPNEIDDAPARAEVALQADRPEVRVAPLESEDDADYWDTEGRPDFEKGVPRDPARGTRLNAAVARVWDAHPRLGLGAVSAAAVGSSRLVGIEDGLSRRRLAQVASRPASVVGSMLQQHRSARECASERANPEPAGEDLGTCGVCGQRPAVIVCGSWLEKFLSLTGPLGTLAPLVRRRTN